MGLMSHGGGGSQEQQVGASWEGGDDWQASGQVGVPPRPPGIPESSEASDGP